MESDGSGDDVSSHPTPKGIKPGGGGVRPCSGTPECQGHSHPKLLELKKQGRRVHNSSALSCSQWFPGQGLFPSGYLSTNLYQTHFNCLLIKGLRVVGGDELSSSCKGKRMSMFSSVQILGKSGGERSECWGNL